MSSKKLILGTVQFGLNYGINNKVGQPSYKEVFDILDFAWMKGIDTLDTAVHYGNAMNVVGAYHQQTNKRFKVVSKFQEKPNLNLKKEIEQSLRLLNISCLEGLLSHSFDFFTTSVTLIKELEYLKMSGLVKKIGVSIYSNEQLSYLINSNLPIDLIQLPFNLLDNYTRKGTLLKKAKERGIEIHTRSTFLQGLFFKRLDNIPRTIQPLLPYLNEIHRLAIHSKIPMHQLALNYAIETIDIDKVLIGIDSLQQLKHNLVAIQQQHLSPHLLESLNNIRVKETRLIQPVNW